MAAPISHIFLAVQMLSGPFKGMFDEKAFIVGTSFPDIRYLKVVERCETHFKNVSLQGVIQEPDSFKAGMLFHSFVDEQREAYVVAHKLYDELPQFRFMSQSLKFAEDEVLQSQFRISDYQAYFDDILESEKAYGIDPKHIRLWHDFLQGYFKGDYTGHDLIMRYFDLNYPDTWFFKRWFFSWYYGWKMQQVMRLVVDDENMKNLILDFYMDFTNNV